MFTETRAQDSIFEVLCTFGNSMPLTKIYLVPLRSYTIARRGVEADKVQSTAAGIAIALPKWKASCHTHMGEETLLRKCSVTLCQWCEPIWRTSPVARSSPPGPSWLTKKCESFRLSFPIVWQVGSHRGAVATLSWKYTTDRLWLTNPPHYVFIDELFCHF